LAEGEFESFGGDYRGTANCSTWNNLKWPAMTQFFAVFDGEKHGGT